MHQGAALSFIQIELKKAQKEAPPFTSCEEGYRAIYRGVSNLEVNLQLLIEDMPMERIRGEAVQVAAMALRFLIDLC